MRSCVIFLKESLSELKKVSWPSAEQIVQQSRRVLVSIFIASCFFGFVNYVLFLGIQYVF